MLWALNFNIYKYRKLTMIINQLFTTVSSNRVTEKEYKNCPVDFYIFQQEIQNSLNSDNFDENLSIFTGVFIYVLYGDDENKLF